MGLFWVKFKLKGSPLKYSYQTALFVCITYCKDVTRRSCGKVMFSQASVCSREVVWSKGRCGVGSVYLGLSTRGVCTPSEMITAAGSTHPTGMHTCCEKSSLTVPLNIRRL